MADASDGMVRRMEWWPELGAAFGVLAGGIRGFAEGRGSVGFVALVAAGAVFVVAALVHRLTKRAFFDRHLEHFLAAQVAAAIVLSGVAMGITKDVVATGAWSWPLFDIAFSLVVGGLAYWIIFVLERRSIIRRWDEPDADEEE